MEVLGVQSSLSFFQNTIIVVSVIAIEVFLRVKRTKKPMSLLYIIIAILSSIVLFLVLVSHKADKVLQNTKD